MAFLKYQKNFVEELFKLQNIYDHEKEESKAFEKNIAQFRGEVLELKKEKHKLSDILKLKEEECETLNIKCYKWCFGKIYQRQKWKCRNEEWWAFKHLVRLWKCIWKFDCSPIWTLEP